MSSTFNSDLRQAHTSLGKTVLNKTPQDQPLRSRLSIVRQAMKSLPAEPSLPLLWVSTQDQCVPLTDGLVVGGGETAGLRIASRFISAEHLSFAQIGENWEMQDLSSKNGTLLNGRRIERVLLGNGDVIEMADVSLVVLLSA